MTGQNVRDTVNCKSCSKPRCIYTSRALSDREKEELKNVKRNYDYVCGCLITPEVSYLSGEVFTRLEMHCNTPVAWEYYSATKIPLKKDVCSHCSRPGAIVDKETKKAYKTVLPICETCKVEGKKTIARGPIKTAKGNKARARQSKI